MYGLFEVTYDYYTWEDFVCGAKDARDLLRYVDPEIPLCYGSSDKEYANGEVHHFLIKEIKILT